MPLNSSLCQGVVRHRRYKPISHRFSYSLFMPLLDLDELEGLDKEIWFFNLKKWGIASFYYKDYMEGKKNTKEAVQDKVHQLTGMRLSGKVLTLCHLRYFGLYFSPVNFYYLYDDKQTWRYLLAEVSNTPWNERHYYAIPACSNFSHSKAFHVSPFNPIEQEYRWQLKPLEDKAFIHLNVLRKTQKEFDATLLLKRFPLSGKTLASAMIKMPSMTLKMLVYIYWQAVKLWFKGAVFYTHSSNLKD